MLKKKSVELTDSQKRFIQIYDKRLMSKKSERSLDKANNGRGKTDEYYNILIRERIHEITGVASVREHLDINKIPAGYPNLLDTKEPKLKKIINFLRANPEPAKILYLYIDHLNEEYESSVSNRNKSIYELFNKLIEANKRIIELSKNANEIKDKVTDNKKYTDFIINEVKNNPKIWRKYFKIVDEYAREKIKGSKEKISDYISREILNNSVSRKSVNDMLSRLYKIENEKKRQIIAIQK